MWRHRGIKHEISEETEKKLEPAQASRYRALAARANYLAQDRPDIQFATNALCREMSEPTVRGWNGLKRLGRYVVSHPRYVQEFKRQGTHQKMVAWVGTNYAGCNITRRSTIGGLVTFKIVAFSVGETYYYGMVNDSAMAKGYSGCDDRQAL